MSHKLSVQKRINSIKNPELVFFRFIFWWKYSGIGVFFDTYMISLSNPNEKVNDVVDIPGI